MDDHRAIPGAEDLGVSPSSLQGLILVPFHHDTLVLNPASGCVQRLSRDEEIALRRLRRTLACEEPRERRLLQHLHGAGLFAEPAADRFAARIVMIEPVDGCDLACPICYRRHRFSGAMMEDAWFDEAVAFVAANPQAAITVSGGECTLHPRIEDMAMRLAALPNETQIVTNGSRVSDRLLSTCRDAGWSVAFSLDGYDEARNAETRDREAYGRVMRLVHRCREAGVTMKANVAVTRANVADLDHLLGTLCDLGVARVEFLTYFTRERTVFSLSRAEVEAVMGSLVGLQLRVPEVIVENVRTFHYRSTVRARAHCGAGRQVLNILPSRRVRPCSMMDGEEIVPDGTSLAEYFRSPGAFLASLRAETVDDCSTCRVCDLRHLCRGGCPARTFDASPEGRCPQALFWSVLAEHRALERIYGGVEHRPGDGSSEPASRSITLP